jgi:biopolymer transport protein TolR
MGMAVGPKKGSVKNDINVTPLVDVVLVLLIIFMVITPMLQRGKDVKLPVSKSIDEENKDSDPLIVSVTKDNLIYIEKDQFDKDSFTPALRAELEAKPGRKILLKGDSTLTVGNVREVMDLARKANAKSVALGVEELKE